MKKIFIIPSICFIILFWLTTIANHSFAGDKSGSTFNSKTFQNNTFSSDKKAQNDTKVLGGVPDPPTDDGNPIDTPVGGGISIIALGTFLLILKKRHLNNKLHIQ